MVGPMKNVAPLGGVTVLDFTQIELGPCATQVLGDFGADVIKIERPGAGDLSRVHMKHPSGESAVFWSLNRNKRSVAIDVRAPLGREAVYRLARKADVLVPNFRPGVMERLGFGPEELRAINPRLIYAFGSGYGPTGPYRDKGGQDVLAQAMSGIASRRAEPGAPPEPCATPIADFTAGLLLVQALLQARWRQEFGKRTSKQAIDALESVDILCAPVNTMEAALADPQVANNQMVVEMRHPDWGPIRTVGIPVKLEGTPGSVRLAPPRL